MSDTDDKAAREAVENAGAGEINSKTAAPPSIPITKKPAASSTRAADRNLRRRQLLGRHGRNLAMTSLRDRRLRPAAELHAH
jgi:hypothetical protein